VRAGILENGDSARHDMGPGAPNWGNWLGSPASTRIVPVDAAACRAYRDLGGATTPKSYPITLPSLSSVRAHVRAWHWRGAPLGSLRRGWRHARPSRPPVRGAPLRGNLSRQPRLPSLSPCTGSRLPGLTRRGGKHTLQRPKD